MMQTPAPLEVSPDEVGIGKAARPMSLSRTSMQKLVDAGVVAAVKTACGHRRISRSSLMLKMPACSALSPLSVPQQSLA